MRFSQYFIPTLKENPSDADTISTKLMIRAGMIRKLSAGIYQWYPLGFKVLKKLEQIIRQEMNAIDGYELYLPVIQPKELWSQTNRWEVYGKELLRFKDRKSSEFCIAPTAEEVITDIAKRELRSYRDLPKMFYQFGLKFRDEIRPRFGVMRAREFFMKDAYSFHKDEVDAENYYQKVFDAYSKIFTRCGLNFKSVEAITGTIGGKFSHEFMVLANTGEEEIVVCPACGYSANIEKAEFYIAKPENLENEFKPLEEVYTPQKWSVEDVANLLNLPKSRFIKTVFYKGDGEKKAVVLICGDYEVNIYKVMEILGWTNIELLTEEEYTQLVDCDVGFAGPVGLKQRAKKDFILLGDYSIDKIVNGVSGANKKDYHLMNINIKRDYSPDIFADVRKVQKKDKCKNCKTEFEFYKGIEVAHTFKLGTKYSKAMNATFLDVDGERKNFVMGCYGIGISRTVAAAVEQYNDEDGIIWPKSIAPFEIYILPTNLSNQKIKTVSQKLYNLLISDYDVIYDDRNERAGVKFKDADLIGIPIKIIVGEKRIDENKIEVAIRKTKEKFEVNLEDVKEFIKKLFQNIL